jgi:hypothetical protein
MSNEKSAVGLLVSQALSIGLGATGLAAKSAELAARVKAISPRAFT